MLHQLHESCAVFGLLNTADQGVSAPLYAAMFSLQHRGQNGVGLAGSSHAQVVCEKNLGLVADVLTPDVLRKIERHRLIIGHIRYPSGGEANTPLNVQPLLLRSADGFMAMAHNGRIVNAAQLRKSLQNGGALFQTDTDSEVLLHLLASVKGDITHKIAAMMQKARGSYALTLMLPDTLVGIRDPWGIRPLCIGRVGKSWALASESCAFVSAGGEMVRNVRPGEAVALTPDGPVTLCDMPRGKGNLCSFEYVYFARPDSVMDGLSVFSSRERMGRLLAKAAPADADMVAGVPDSALAAAMGYAKESGIPYGQALIKSPYFGRTFIAETQAARDIGVRLKLHALSDQAAGKRIVLVDDSIVRGTSMRQLVSLLRASGALEIHLRIASPPVMHPCHYGINTPTRKRLISTQLNADELCQRLGADSLAFLPQQALEDACACDCGLCVACFNGDNPIS